MPRALRSKTFWEKLLVAEGLMVARRAESRGEGVVTRAVLRSGPNSANHPAWGRRQQQI